MRQVAAVFRKDVRRLWPQLAGALGLTALVGWIDSQPSATGAIAPLAGALWAACWIYLAASVIQQERLSGDCQYWLTRPYDWRQLLSAKAVFVLAFAVLPLVVVKAAVLSMNGIAPLRYISSVLVTSLAFIGAVGLIAGALAAVTESLTQFLWGFLALTAVVAASIAIGVNHLAAGDWGPVEWFRAAAAGIVIAAAGIPVLLLQYRLRRTFLSRVILGAAVLLIAADPLGNAWHSAWALQGRRGSSRPDALPVRFSFDATARPRMRYGNAPYFPGLRQEGLYLPIRVSGIPNGAAVISERVAVTLEAGDGRRWRSGWTPAAAIAGTDPLADVRLILADGPAWQYLDVDRAFYRAVKDAPVQIHVSIALVLLTDRRRGTLQANGRTERLPQDGICEVSQVPMLSRTIRNFGNLVVLCAWPRPGPDRAYVRANSRASAIASPLLLTAGASGPLSIDQSVWQRGAAILSARADDRPFTIETWRAAAWLERNFDISGVRLNDYVAPRPTDPQ
jgi:hypothetical protein